MNAREISIDQNKEELKHLQNSLVKKIDFWTRNKVIIDTMIPKLSFYRHEKPIESTSYMHEPSICLIARGSKRVILGAEKYAYDSNHYLITSVNLPVIAQIIGANKETPYLGLTLRFDLKEIAQMMVDHDFTIKKSPVVERAMNAGTLTYPLLKALMRLIDLLDEPDNISSLAPLAMKEILFRLLISEQGLRLRQTATEGSHSYQIALAIDWLKENYSRSFKVDELSAHVGMSTSSFHHHFREVTAMSPLQYQKSLRLHKARQLMLTKKIDASSASFQVGYESPSQFNREYNRQFGAPPIRDIKKLQQMFNN